MPPNCLVSPVRGPGPSGTERHGKEWRLGSKRKTLPQKIGEAKPRGEDTPQAAQLSGTNRQYVSDAKGIQEEAPDLADKVRGGEMKMPGFVRQGMRFTLIPKKRSFFWDTPPGQQNDAGPSKSPTPRPYRRYLKAAKLFHKRGGGQFWGPHRNPNPTKECGLADDDWVVFRTRRGLPVRSLSGPVRLR